MSITATVDDTTLDNMTGTVTLDASWSPYTQAELSFVTDDALAILDPRDTDAPRLLLELEGRPFDLGIRGRRVNPDGTVSVRLASDEALLDDYALVATTAYTPVTTSLSTLVSYVLGLIGASLATGSDATIDPTEAVWAPGMTAWAYLSPIVQASGMRLWCDEARQWRLDRDTRRLPQLITISYLGDTMTDYGDELGRDNGLWFDAVVIVYKWTDGAGAQQVAYDTASVAGYSKVKTITYDDTRFPGAGAAERVLKRARARGHNIPIRAISDFSVTPGMSVRVTIPDTDEQTGSVRAVSWDLGSYEMDLTTVDLVDTPLTSWILDTPGVSWLDVPSGINWLEDI